MADIGHRGSIYTLPMADISHGESVSPSQWPIWAIGRVQHPPNGQYWPSGGCNTPNGQRWPSGGCNTLLMANVGHREGLSVSQWRISAIGRVIHSPNGQYRPLGWCITLLMADISHREGVDTPSMADMGHRESDGKLPSLLMADINHQERGVKGSQTGPVSVSGGELWPAPDTASCSAAAGTMS
ncbi:hypothetical protein PCANC_05780 [Puccinia coronata f. sp. avenae]|uniref:Uncharacterized protein n=1 Tax=Puccinia coronata f. sp. avenae TaxID=200324 RepID=A0A2N5V5H4_9BASI|nr:hypothetical protein PCASD_12237 [Puccinia coronata f. sp. avenae]PLW45254.1 hypothetical protein PCASD_04034 [Puccinia coronata f. sp. avenae]PLW53111.1 hypothetical protein PCANC_05780 [Puccinia coronata f. sp. avenae]